MYHEQIRKYALSNMRRKWYLDVVEAFDIRATSAQALLRKFPDVMSTFTELSKSGGNSQFPIDAAELLAFCKPKLKNVCEHCGTSTPFDKQTKLWRAFCSRQCVAFGTRDKKKSTCLAKYGSENPSQVKQFQDRRADTMIERHGVANIFASKKVQKQIKKTNIAKYGVSNPSQSETIKQKKVATFKRNFGTSHWTKSKSMKHKLHPFTKESLAKGRATMLLKYGEDNPFKVQRIQEDLWIEKFDKYQDIPEGEMPTFKHKLVTDKRGQRHCVQGYEDRAILHMDKFKWITRISTKWNEVPRYRYKQNGQTRNYYPDMIVFSQNSAHVIEVKSEYTLMVELDRNIKKFQVATKSCLRKGYSFWLFCYLKSGKLIKIKNPKCRADLEAAGLL